MMTSNLMGNRKLEHLGQKQMLKELDERLSSSHFILLVRESFYVLIKGQCDR